VEIEMARITLGRLEVEKERLPAVCLRCGAPAAQYVSEEFSGRPRMSRWVRRLSWPTPLLVILLIVVMEWSVNFGPKWQGVSVVTYLVLFLSALMIFAERIWNTPTYRMMASAPLCDAHEKHWRWRRNLAFSGLILLAGLIAAGFLNTGPRGLLYGGGTLLFALLLIPSVLAVSAGIRATEHLNSSITLARVSAEFVEAVEAARARRADDDSRTGPFSPDQPSTGSGDPATPPPGGSPPDSQPQSRG
jgi:hypothetical protein